MRDGVTQAKPRDAWHLAAWAASKAHLFPDPLRPEIKVDHAGKSLLAALLDECVCFYHRHGFIVGKVQSCPINHEIRIAQTLTFVSESHGLELLRSFEDWAREEGCAYVCVSVLAGRIDERRLRVWGRLGYDCGDHTLVKKIL